MPNNYACKPLEEFSDISFRELTGSINGRALSRRTCVIIYARTIAAMAGTEAERLLLPDRPPPQTGNTGDMKAATHYTGFFTNNPAAILDKATSDAARILAARRHQVEAVARALLEQKTLSGAEIDDVLSESVTPAMRAERSRRRNWSATVERAGAFGIVMEPLRM